MQITDLPRKNLNAPRALCTALVLASAVLLPGQSPLHAAGTELEWTGHPGPWGQLVIRTTYLEAPDDLLATKQQPTSVPRWCFLNTTDAALKQLFDRAGLPTDMQSRLFDPKRRIMQQTTLIIFPSADDLVAMTQEMREVIYPELAKSSENNFHQYPLVIPGGDLDGFLRSSSLTSELQTLVRKMVWRHGGYLYFSDVRTVLQRASTMAEASAVFKTITRTGTLLVEVMLPPAGINADTFFDYWTAGNPEADTLPLLRAAISHSSAARLDLVHFLPPLMRRRLYTYPTMDLAALGRLPDCHWTSLNFFNLTPQHYFLDSELVGSRLSSDYDQVKPPYRFGDVLCYFSNSTITKHSCVFIADDIVFTKNGDNALAPWVLMRFEDVNALYPLRVQGFRLKRTPQR